MQNKKYILKTSNTIQIIDLNKLKTELYAYTLLK